MNETAKVSRFRDTFDDGWMFGNPPRSTVGETCPLCRTIHCARDVVAVGRFSADGPRGYRPSGGGELRPTRAEAMTDACLARTTPAPTPAHPTTHAEDTEATTKETDRG